MNNCKIEETKICKSCGIEKSLDSYHKDKSKSDNYCRPNCKECENKSNSIRQYNRKKKKNNFYLKDNKEVKICEICLIEKEINDFFSNKQFYYKICRKCKKEKKILYDREYRKKNIEKEKLRCAKYREKNKELIKIRRKVNAKIKRKIDPCFKLKENISRAIRHFFKKNNSSKYNKSFLKYINYSMSELKIYLENKFEYWMNWDNYGIYSKSWDDENQLTWTWQVDHIIPQCQLHYSSMEDDNFKKCWSLENLRPLSSKQNLINGLELLKRK